jgi:hypothetical protein
MTIRVTPEVSSTYHRDMIAGGLLASLEAFILERLAPEFPEPPDEVHGTIVPCHDDDRYCAPNSVVKDFYAVELSFQTGTEYIGSFESELSYDVKTRTFQPRWWTRKPLVSIKADEEALKALVQAVHNLRNRIDQEKLTEAACPKCSKKLRIDSSPDSLFLGCRGGCFLYNSPRDSESGQLQEGQLFFRQEP